MLSNRFQQDHRFKMLFAGGCHVTGFHAGESDSFPTYASEQLSEQGIQTEILRLPHAKLSHRRRLMSACTECRPDILVLQLGHAELNQTLSHYLKARVTRREQNFSGAAESAPSPLGSVARFHIRATLKWLIDSGLGHPLADFLRLTSLFDLLLADLQKTEIPVRLVMSPLPCADRTRMYYRKRALPLYREMAVRHRCEFVDVLSLADSFRSTKFGADEFYYDGMHLGGLGQREVGRAIALVLRVAVEAKFAQVSN